MKKYIALFLLIIIASCKSAAVKNETINLVSDCPKDGHCTVKILTGKSVTTKADENGENFHYELVDAVAKSTIIFEYSKNVPKGVMDAGLREEVIFSIDKDISVGKYNNFPSGAFGRFCYCKGATGYYKIKTGILTVSEKDKLKHFNFQFKVDEVPQITQSFEFTVK